MLYLGFLLLAGILQGVMVSLNAQMGNYFSLFGICFFVHGIALVLLLFSISNQGISSSSTQTVFLSLYHHTLMSHGHMYI